MKKRKLNGLVLRKKTVSNLNITIIGGATYDCGGTPVTFGNGPCGGSGGPDTTWANTTNSICINNCTKTWMNCE